MRPLFDRSRLLPRKPEQQKTTFVSIGRSTALVIDDFYEDPGYVRSLALSLDYHESRGRYPGYHASVSLDPSYLAEVVNRHTGAPHELDEHSRGLVFGMMTRSISPDLRRQGPHIDLGRELAGVVYLNPPDQCRGGTAFYRHRATGLISPPAAIGRRLARLMKDEGLSSPEDLLDWMLAPPPPEGDDLRLTSDDDDRFRRVELLEMKYNRLVVYPSALFHSAYVEPGDFGDTPETRRLTQVFFLKQRRAAVRAAA